MIEEKLENKKKFKINLFYIELISFYSRIPGNVSCLEISVLLQRRCGYYIINVYVPSVLIVGVSMLTFWIPRDAVPARVTLGITSLLTIITKQASMPDVSYVVALGAWLSCCTAFVFLSLLEYAAVIASDHRRRIPDKPLFDQSLLTVNNYSRI